ncbi:MAG: NHLP leader peptide family RiPP precursor [Cyanobacteria bacterium P01_A01_bin.40]
MTDLIKHIHDFILADDQLSQKLNPIKLTDGQILFQQGDRDSAFYLLKSGQIRIYTCDLSKAGALRDRDGNQILLNTLKAGGILGEIALIDRRSHSAKAVSLGCSNLLCLNRDDFWQRIQTSPELSRWLIQLLSQRIDYLLAYIAHIRDWIQQIIVGDYQDVINNIEEVKIESDSSYFSISLLIAATESLKRMVQTIKQIKEGRSPVISDERSQQEFKLKVEIDQDKHRQRIEEIVNADYFTYLIELAERKNTVSNIEKSRENKHKVLSFNKSRIHSSSQVNSLQNPEIKQALIRGLKNRSEVFNRLILKAWSDEEFKQKLLTNPRAVYAQEFGYQLPDNLKFEVVEETLDAIKITLPVNPFLKIPEEELSEEVLDAIAGGNWNINKNLFFDDRL